MPNSADEIVFHDVFWHYLTDNLSYFWQDRIFGIKGLVKDILNELLQLTKVIIDIDEQFLNLNIHLLSQFLISRLDLDLSQLQIVRVYEHRMGFIIENE